MVMGYKYLNRVNMQKKKLNKYKTNDIKVRELFWLLLKPLKVKKHFKYSHT